MTLRQAAQQALEALESAEDQLAKPYSTQAQHAITALRAALAEPEHCSPNELLLEEMLQNSLKMNRELVQALQDIQRTVIDDEESAQAVARAVLKNVGINQ